VNTTKPLPDDANVRKAISMATNFVTRSTAAVFGYVLSGLMSLGRATPAPGLLTSSTLALTLAQPGKGKLTFDAGLPKRLDGIRTLPDAR